MKYDYEFDLRGATHLGCIVYAGVSLDEYKAAMATIRPHINPPDPTFAERVKIDREKELVAEKGLFRDAQKLVEWDGWVYWEGSLRGVEDFSDEWASDGCWASADDLLSSIAAYNTYNAECDEEEDRIIVPHYVWCCYEQSFAHEDVRDLFVDRLEEETYEGAWESVPENAIAELQTALDKFYAETDKIVGYYPDYKKALILNKDSEA